MSADDQQGRLNYRLHYKSEIRHDWVEQEHNFRAENDEDARSKALSFLEHQNSRDKEKAEKESEERVYSSFLSLHRVEHFMKTIEETVRI